MGRKKLRIHSLPEFYWTLIPSWNIEGVSTRLKVSQISDKISWGKDL